MEEIISTCSEEGVVLGIFPCRFVAALSTVDSLAHKKKADKENVSQTADSKS